MSGAHHHDEVRGNFSFPLKIGLALTLSFFIAEFGIAIFSQSIALLGDAFHNLSHSAILIFSLYGIKLASKPPTKTMTYGLARLESLVPATNAIFLAVVGVWLIMEGYFRFLSPAQVIGFPIIIVSSLDIASNAIVALLMKKHWSNLTIKTVIAHLFLDALASLGVIFGGAAIVLWNWYRADSLAAIFIGGIALISSALILYKLGYSLMEGTPSNISVDTVYSKILQNKAVLDIEDLHIWSIGQRNYLTAHLIVTTAALSRIDEFLADMSSELRHHFSLSHITVQCESKKCDSENH